MQPVVITQPHNHQTTTNKHLQQIQHKDHIKLLERPMAAGTNLLSVLHLIFKFKSLDLHLVQVLKGNLSLCMQFLLHTLMKKKMEETKCPWQGQNDTFSFVHIETLFSCSFNLHTFYTGRQN